MGPQLKVVERTRTATMLCAASGNPDPEITWYKDFLPIDPSASNGRIKQLRSGKESPTSCCLVPLLLTLVLISLPRTFVVVVNMGYCALQICCLFVFFNNIVEGNWEEYICVTHVIVWELKLWVTFTNWSELSWGDREIMVGPNWKRFIRELNEKRENQHSTIFCIEN